MTRLDAHDLMLLHDGELPVDDHQRWSELVARDPEAQRVLRDWEVAGEALRAWAERQGRKADGLTDGIMARLEPGAAFRATERHETTIGRTRSTPAKGHFTLVLLASRAPSAFVESSSGPDLCAEACGPNQARERPNGTVSRFPNLDRRSGREPLSRRSGIIRAGVAGAVALAAAVALTFGRGAAQRLAGIPTDAGETAALSAVKPSALPRPGALAGTALDSSLTIELVDFGGKNGTIFLVYAESGEKTPVVWLADEPIPGEHRTKKL